MGRPEPREEREEEREEEALEPAAPGPEAAPAAPRAGATDDPWAAVLEAGAQWLSRLAAAAALPAEGEAAPSEKHQGLEIDPGTGRRYLRLPVPDPRALAKLADALSALLASANERTGQRRNPVANIAS